MSQPASYGSDVEQSSDTAVCVAISAVWVTVTAEWVTVMLCVTVTAVMDTLKIALICLACL